MGNDGGGEKGAVGTKAHDDIILSSLHNKNDITMRSCIGDK